MERNMINSLMCLCMPRECVWLERWPLPSMEDVLRVPALQKAVLMDSSHNLAKAKVSPSLTQLCVRCAVCGVCGVRVV